MNYWGDLSDANKATLEKAGARRVVKSLWDAHDLLAPLDQFYKSQETEISKAS